MRKLSLGIASLSLFCASLAAGQPSGIVKKTVDTFDLANWEMSQWNSGQGQVLSSKDAAPDCDSTGAMELQARFSGNGFEAVAARPRQPLTIPGDAKRITIRVKRSDSRLGLKVAFRDGWGRDANAGQPMEWWIPFEAGQDWQTRTFEIPTTWVRPISIDSLLTHNWDTQKTQTAPNFWVDQLEAETDLSQVDPATGALKTWTPEPNPADPAKALKEAPKPPLLSADFSTSAEYGIFAGEEPKATLEIRNWKPGKVTGKGVLQVMDSAGKSLSSQNLDVAVDSNATYEVPLPVPAFGRYTLKASLELSDGSKLAREIVFAKLPALKQLTEEQKVASPYGINVHSGARIVLNPFKKAGIVWFREYAFQYDWVVRAKGDDKHYAGWPFFNKMMQAYKGADVKVLPVLQQCMKPPVVRDGKVVGRIGPDETWTREIADVILAFPQVTHWELNNEYDLPAQNALAEEASNWANYRAYHKRFGDLVSILGSGNMVAIENGRAGIWPNREKNCIESGDFEHIGVVNSHHYCGTDSPELNFENFNMGVDASSQRFGSLYDELRAVNQAAKSDGSKRQSWVTEFGWDTLAGPIVSPYEQAVYLQRFWMLAMAAGNEKAFWFYNFDSADPKNFFDGCGLLGPNGEPKLSLCSTAGMTSIMPNPHYVGTLNAGDNTWGYIFENDGKLIASLWSIAGNEGPSASFKAQQLYDYLGNKLPGTSAKLTMAPVYAVGLDKADVWYKQTAYSLKSKQLTAVAAGDMVNPVLLIDNNRQEPIDCKVSLVLPDGWKAQSPEFSATVAPGAKQELTLPFTVSVLEAQGIKDAKLVISEGAKLKEVPFRIAVQPALAMRVTALSGQPGPTSAIAHVTNLSGKPRTATLRLKLPDTWKAPTPAVEVAALKPGEQRDVKVDLTWSTDWAPGQSAKIELDTGEGKVLGLPLIPGQSRIHHVQGIKFDGDLADWPAKAELSNWMFGATVGEPRARIYLAWASEGLYGAVEVHDSKIVAKNPKTFWDGDTLELFIDTANDKQSRDYHAGDHQFWLIPQVDQNRVYVGQWKRNSEIAETKFDIKGVTSSAKKTADGYVMEFLLPASALQQYQPVAGRKIGVNLNLAVRGQNSNREVYWPQPKDLGAPSHPETWGVLELAE